MNATVSNIYLDPRGCLKRNCVQEPTDGKNCQFLIPSFGPMEHCHGYKYQNSHLRL